MLPIETLLLAVMMFFLLLPNTDHRTVQMRLLVLCMLASVFAASVTWTHARHRHLATIQSTH
jgi:hypothetical protein